MIHVPYSNHAPSLESGVGGLTGHRKIKQGKGAAGLEEKARGLKHVSVWDWERKGASCRLAAGQKQVHRPQVLLARPDWRKQVAAPRSGTQIPQTLHTKITAKNSFSGTEIAVS
eukprot:1702371-Rhodomonas_salina.4